MLQVDSNSPSTRNDEEFDWILKVHGSEKNWKSILETINKVYDCVATAFTLLAVVLVPAGIVAWAAGRIVLSLPKSLMIISALVFCVVVSKKLVQTYVKEQLLKGTLQFESFQALDNNLLQLSKFGVSIDILKAIHEKKGEFYAAKKSYNTDIFILEDHINKEKMKCDKRLVEIEEKKNAALNSLYKQFLDEKMKALTASKIIQDSNRSKEEIQLANQHWISQLEIPRERLKEVEKSCLKYIEDIAKQHPSE